MKWFWMSFCDADKPEGSQLLGTCIIDAIDWMHAITRSHILGVNPGGEVKLHPIHLEPNEEIRPEYQRRLMPPEESKADKGKPRETWIRVKQHATN